MVMRWIRAFDPDDDRFTRIVISTLAAVAVFVFLLACIA
jgi:hypothetical protein